MRIITPTNIARYSECPRFCYHSWKENQEKISPLGSLIQNVIQAGYLYWARKEKPAPWKLIKSWTETNYIRELANIEDYKETKSVLGKLSIWFDNYYLDSYLGPGITNVPISLALGKNNFLKDSIPILTSGKVLRLFDFAEGDPAGYRLYMLQNDFLLLSRVWAFQKSTDVLPGEYVRFIIGKESIRTMSLTIDNLYLSKANCIMKQILQGIKDEVWYPSYGSNCDICPHKNICHI